ncbi:hypothetical protein WL76_31150 [Burkholderia ubonensis]|uniref:hypothetical protein n=1 Tax=Burkholderia ubonensis TaxID=101571 RepID=UPI00075C902F|nr:hypothetical protein [Burkholderia ubonensis]KWE44639.1 hypothetical protein WL76_31150 [Burkholderia ubonensis]
MIGISRASKVQVNVVTDNVKTREGSRCKLVGINGATVVGISSTLRYNGAELADRPALVDRPSLANIRAETSRQV